MYCQSILNHCLPLFLAIAASSLPSKVSSTSRLVSTCTNTSPCYQQWEIVLTLSRGSCSFDGSYKYIFGVACSNNDTCPINKSDNETISFYLSTGDVCAVVRNTVTLTNSLSTYK